MKYITQKEEKKYLTNWKLPSVEAYVDTLIKYLDNHKNVKKLEQAIMAATEREPYRVI